MAGRPRKPTALKLLQGNPGKRKLPKGEVQPKVGCEPPPWLNVKARVQWARLAPRLIELGLLTEIDGDAFAAICMLTAHLAVLGTIQGTDIAGCTKELRQLWGRFGMTPADRAKVTPVAPSREKDAFGEMFGG